MKKTLTALCFALCASFAVAQTSHQGGKAMKASKDLPAVKLEASDAKLAGDYKASIFTKAEGDTLGLVTFGSASDFTTGTLSTRDSINGAPVAIGHTIQGAGSTWARIENVAPANYESDWPVTANQYSTSANLGNIQSTTVANGWMFMAMMEQIAAWGGHGNTGGYNAYFQVGPFNTSAALTVDLLFYEFYRKFNNDQCWIDYSADGNNWNAVEINVKNVDVETNNRIHSRGYRVSLPLDAVAQNLYLRFRWSCAADGNRGGAYGYLWAVDDVRLIDGPRNRITMLSNEYFEGFYHQIPQNMNLSMVWNANFRNTGSNTQQNVRGSINYMENRNANAQEIAHTATFASVPYLEDNAALIDPYGWYYANGFGYYTDGSQDTNNVPTGENFSLPTNNVGKHYFFSDLTSDTWDHMYYGYFHGDTVNKSFEAADPVMYQVNALDNEGKAVWARDNGMLTGNSYWIYGMVDANTFSDNIESEELIGWKNAGYCALLSYLTGDAIPTDNSGRPWVIKGIEYVPATHPQACAPDAIFEPVVFMDSVYEGTDGKYISWKNVDGEALPYTTTMDDLNDDVELYTTGQGEDPEYNTIYIPFPAQPELQAKTNYRIGYWIDEDGSVFSCASANAAGYRDQANTAQYFSDVEGLEDYGVGLYPYGYYNCLVRDEAYQPENASPFHWLHWSTFPMMRLIVGPYETLPTATIAFQCETAQNYGNVYNNNEDDVCGQTETVNANASKTYVAEGELEEKVFVDEIIVNGVQEFKNDTTDGWRNFNLGPVSFNVLTGAAGNENNVVVKFAYYPNVAINTVENNISLSLTPNPATSNVRLNIEGVQGMVDLSIIDMSGRVIRTSKVNAEQAQNINLNGMAKGAYFVRVTNANMSKVEKLIVR